MVQKLEVSPPWVTSPFISLSREWLHLWQLAAHLYVAILAWVTGVVVVSCRKGTVFHRW